MSELENQKDEFQNSALTADNKIDPNAYPSFKRAFWLVFALIFSVQIVQTYYAFKIVMSDQVSSALYLNIEIISITWYVLSVIIIHYSFTIQDLNPLAFYRFDFNILKKHLPQTLKYFAGTAIAVILLSFVTSGTELQLEDQSSTIIILMLFTAVIMAPICEELVFRGYLYSSMIPAFKREKERLVVNAMFFAAAHVFVIVFALGGTIPYYIFILGYLIAKLYQDSKSVLPCILLHMLNNALVSVIDLIKLDIYNTSKLIQASL